MSENTTSTPSKYRIVLYAVLGGMLALSGELMPDDFKYKVQNFVWNNLHISFFWFWLGMIGLLTLLLIWLEIKKESPQDTSSVLGQDLEAIRDEIIKRFAKRYKKRYDEKLDERITLNLELKYTQVGTEIEFVDRYFAKAAKTEEDIQKELIDVVLTHRYVLILGQPGAGKTTLLLETAMALLSKAKQDKIAIPVIFNLSSWRKEYTNFSKWLIDMLVEGNGFSKKLAEEALLKKQILPLLDGLDELGLSFTEKKDREILRSQCLVAINQFLNEHNPKYMVICSRIDEYKTIADNAPVKAEILVKPLTIEQIENALKPRAENPNIEYLRPHANITAAQNILYLLKNTPSVSDTLKVPFYFHLATQVFDNQIISEKLPANKDDFEKYLVETFVAKKFKSERKKTLWSTLRLKKWLMFLASFLKNKNTYRFELFHLDSEKGYLAHFITLCYAMMFYISSTLMISYFFSFPSGTLSFNLKLLDMFFAGIIYSFIVEYLGSRFFNKTYILKIQSKSLFNLKSLKKTSLLSLVHGVIALFILLFLLKIHNKVALVFFSFTFALGSFVIQMIKLLLFEALRETFSLLEIEKPYQRLKQGLLFELLFFSCFFAISVFTYLKLKEQSFNGVLYFTLQAIAFGLTMSLMTTVFCRHFSVRLVSFFYNKTPLRLVHFLNYATDTLRFLERDGGSWRFRHQILQEYFASLAEKGKNEENDI
jgi:DNA-binding ferritin-like protein (Dps family)